MNSKITVEIDFSNNRIPVIQIMHRKSTDTRDQILTEFLQMFGGASSWCNIKWVQDYREGPESGHFSRVLITPITKEQLPEQAAVMAKQADLNLIYLQKNENIVTLGSIFEVKDSEGKVIFKIDPNTVLYKVKE